MNELNAPNSSSINTNDNNSYNNERKRKRIYNNNATMESANRSKHLKSNYYYLLDTESEFQCDADALSKYEKHVQEHNTQETNNKQQTSNDRQNNSITAALPDHQSTSININNQHPNVNTNNHKKNSKIPPIHIFDVNPNEFISFIESGLKIEDFKIREFRNKFIIFLNSIENYVRVKSHLELTNTKFFTFTPKCIKTKTFLLRGLSADTDPTFIFNELCKQKKDQIEFIKVSKYLTNKSKREGYDLPIFLVQISSDSSVNQLKSIRGLIHRCIQWEPLRKPEIQQCRRCQGFFHSASNCYLSRRCVKCGQQHDAGKCNLANVAENERSKLFCVLCNKFGHPASYRGCEKYKELQKKIREKRQSMSNYKKTNYLNVNSNISYANILKSNATKLNGLENYTNNNDYSNTSFFQDIKTSLQNLSNQIINFQKQLEIQANRIDTLFSLIDV